MSNLTVPAAAGGMPASRHLLLVGAGTAPAALEPDASAALLASIPTWMALKIEVHRDALAELRRCTSELRILADASASLGGSSPPSWLCEAEQARDTAEDRAAGALAALLAERPRSLKDAQDRARHLITVGASLDGAQALSLLLSMTGGEA